MRIALIGCGKVGHIHAAALHSLPDVELVAVCDVDASRANSFGAKYDTQPFSDLSAMWREAKPEAVIIGTPHPVHAQPAVHAAEAGIHVLVEKPMAASLADCDAMLAAAHKHHIKLG